MAYFDSRRSLVGLNPFLDFKFTHICFAVFDYHVTTTFPVNVLVFVLDDDGKGRDFFEVPSIGRKMPLLRDHVYFIPCGLEFKVNITPGITTLAFHFSLTFFHGIDVYSGSRDCVMRRDPELAARFRDILDEKDEPKAICGLKAEAMRFCFSCWPETARSFSPSMRKYEAVFKHVLERGDAEMGVSELAEFAGRRQDVFSRAFARDVGRPPKEFLRDDLLKKISARLLAPKASVKETAAELKFSSEFYMSRFFKKHTGLSPSEYQSKFRPPDAAHCQDMKISGTASRLEK